MSGGRARAQHYQFAHRVVPQVFTSDPSGFMAFLLRDGDRFLRFYWDKIGERVDAHDRVEGDGPHGEIRKIARDIQVALIRLPEPKFMTEAYFTAAAYHPQLDGHMLADYYTLEFSVSLPGGEPYTVLGRWVGTTHFNFGAGPQPEPELFLEAVAEKLAGRPG